MLLRKPLIVAAGFVFIVLMWMYGTVFVSDSTFIQLKMCYSQSQDITTFLNLKDVYLTRKNSDIRKNISIFNNTARGKLFDSDSTDFQWVTHDSTILLHRAYNLKLPKSGTDVVLLTGVSSVDESLKLKCVGLYNDRSVTHRIFSAQIDVIDRGWKYKYTAIYVICYLCGADRPLAVSVIDMNGYKSNLFYLPLDNARDTRTGTTSELPTQIRNYQSKAEVPDEIKAYGKLSIETKTVTKLIANTSKIATVLNKVSMSKLPIKDSMKDDLQSEILTNNKLQTKHTPKDDFEYDYAACISPMFGNYDRPLAVVEWIELNRLFGVEFFIFYVLDVSNKVMDILRFYKSLGIIDIVEWKIDKWISAHLLDYYGQQAASNDCLARIRGKADRVMFTDLDEYIIPQRPTDYTFNDLLVRIPEHSALVFRQTQFYVDMPTDNTNLVTQDYVYRQKEILEANIRTKLIVKSDSLYMMGVHDVWKLFYGDTYVVDPNLALLQHYRANMGGNSESLSYITNRCAIKYSEDLKHNLNKVITSVRYVFS